MRLSAIAAILGVAVATGCGESSQAGVIGPGDFGPGAVVQSFDSLSENYFGAYGPLILSGVTYATDLPGTYNVASGSDCLSGQCFGTRSQGAGLLIELDNPVERVGGYLHGRGDQTPYVIFYDANHVGIDGLYPNQVSADGFFFGFQAGTSNIKYIEIAPNAGQGIATLDNFTYEIASPVPEPTTWAMLLIGFAGVVRGPNPRERERSGQPIIIGRKAPQFLKPVWGNSWDFRGKRGPQTTPGGRTAPPD